MVRFLIVFNSNLYGVFKKNSVSSTTHPNENSGATGVYHSKGNISDEFRERRTRTLEFIAVRRNL